MDEESGLMLTLGIEALRGKISPIFSIKHRGIVNVEL